MKFRTWRRVISIVCSLLFVLVGLLWMRSYWRMDALTFRISREREMFVVSQISSISVGIDRAAARTGYITRALPAAVLGKQAAESRSGFGGAMSERSASYIMVPHWFVLVVIVAVAGSIQLGARFSMRVLLLIFPLVALAIGLLVCLHILGGALPRGH